VVISVDDWVDIVDTAAVVEVVGDGDGVVDVGWVEDCDWAMVVVVSLS